MIFDISKKSVSEQITPLPLLYNNTMKK